MKKFLCYLFGHNYFIINEHNNHRSLFRDFECSRCEKTKHTQYDIP